MHEQNLTQGNILKSLLTFAFPVLLALFLQAMYGAVDLMVVGKFAGTSEQSGVATGSQLFNMATLMITGLSMGITVFVGEAIGAGRKEDAGRGIGAGLFVFGILAVAITAFLVPCSNVLTGLMHAPQEAFAPTASYVRICGAGAVFIIAYNVIGAIFRGLGDSRTPLLTVGIACAFNIVGDLLLVAVFHLGATGAAIATVFAQAISVVISLALIRRRQLPFSFQLSFIRPRGRFISKILRVGIPIALQDMLVHFSFMFIQVIVNDMGVTESAAVGVAEKVCAFLMLVASAYMQSISAFVAQNNGAQLPERSRKALFYGIGTAFIAGLAMGLLAFFGGSGLAAIFSNEPAVISAAHEYLKAYAIDCLLTAVMFCFVGYFNGCEKTIFVMLQGIVGAFCVRIPVVLLMSKIPGATLFHIGLGTPASTVVQIVLCLIAYRIYRKKESGGNSSCAK